MQPIHQGKSGRERQVGMGAQLSKQPSQPLAFKQYRLQSAPSGRSSRFIWIIVWISLHYLEFGVGVISKINQHLFGSSDIGFLLCL